MRGVTTSERSQKILAFKNYFTHVSTIVERTRAHRLMRDQTDSRLCAMRNNEPPPQYT
jgi:hypothetical protein